MTLHCSKRKGMKTYILSIGVRRKEKNGETDFLSEWLLNTKHF